MVLAHLTQTQRAAIRTGLEVAIEAAVKVVVDRAPVVACRRCVARTVASVLMEELAMHLALALKDGADREAFLQLLTDAIDLNQRIYGELTPTTEVH